MSSSSAPPRASTSGTAAVGNPTVAEARDMWCRAELFAVDYGGHHERAEPQGEVYIWWQALELLAGRSLR